MISFNPKKVFDFLYIIVSSFFVAMVGNYFFQWDFELGLLSGLILGAWSTLYDVAVNTIMLINGEEEEDDE